LANCALTIQYSYLFGIVPALMIGAVDDILFHVKRMGAVTRMLVSARSPLSRRNCSTARGAGQRRHQFMLYGLVGFYPATSRPAVAKRRTPARRETVIIRESGLISIPETQR